MQELLTGKKRLPGFSGEWEVKSLGEISTTTKGSQLCCSESIQDGMYPHLNGGIAPSGYAEKTNMSENTIAISEGGNSCGYVQLMRVPYWCGGHCYSVIPKCIDNSFLYQALKAQQSNLMGLRVGSGLPNVQKTALLSFKLCYPSNDIEQAAIAKVLTVMDAEIDLLETKLAKTRQIKQGMMHNLLTGKIRLI
ncbi:MAG: restriction endonuclease subunit S [Desulfobulbaceae bacterium]|nr:restriction endonuclease subunit S [Desulfobulbaceae bacterium]